MKYMKIAAATLSATLLFNQGAFADRADCPAAVDQTFSDFKRFVIARGSLNRELDAAFETVTPSQSGSEKKSALERFVKSRNADGHAWCSERSVPYTCETENPIANFFLKRDSLDASFAYEAEAGALTLCATKSFFPPESESIVGMTYDGSRFMPTQAEYRIKSCRTDTQGKAGPVSTRATMIVWSQHNNGGPKNGHTLSGAEIANINNVAVQLDAEIKDGDYTCRRLRTPFKYEP